MTVLKTLQSKLYSGVAISQINNNTAVITAANGKQAKAIIGKNNIKIVFHDGLIANFDK